MLETGPLPSLSAVRDAAEFFKRSNVEIFRPEGKLIAELLASRPLTIKQAMSVAECSYRGFYLMIERLTAVGLIEIQHSSQDRRVKTIAIREELRVAFLGTNDI